MRIPLCALAVTMLAACPKTTGTIAVTWSLAKDGVPSTCAATGVEKIRVQIIDGMMMVKADDLYDCTDGESAPVTLPKGDYTVSLSALAVGGSELDTITLEENVKGESTISKEVTFDVGGTPPQKANLVVSWRVFGTPPSNGCSDIVNGTMNIKIGGTSVATVACIDSPQTVMVLPGVQTVTLHAMSSVVPTTCDATGTVNVAPTGGMIDLNCQ